MDLIEIKDKLFKIRNGFEEDLRNLADEMEALDPAAKDFADLDFEYNYINGQVAGINYALVLLMEDK
jgi:hypothetical protein